MGLGQRLRCRTGAGELIGLFKKISFEERIAEFALGIVAPQESLEVGQLGVQRLHARRRYRKQLAPMRPGAERRQLVFDQRQQLPDRGPILDPGEVDGNAVLLIARAHPQTVRRDGAHFGYLQQRRNAVAHLINGLDGCQGHRARHLVFGLQLRTAAGREIHAKMRQPLVP